MGCWGGWNGVLGDGSIYRGIVNGVLGDGYRE